MYQVDTVSTQSKDYTASNGRVINEWFFEKDQEGSIRNLIDVLLVSNFYGVPK
jgi:hypothetical protein